MPLPLAAEVVGDEAAEGLGHEAQGRVEEVCFRHAVGLGTRGIRKLLADPVISRLRKHELCPTQELV